MFPFILISKIDFKQNKKTFIYFTFFFLNLGFFFFLFSRSGISSRRPPASSSSSFRFSSSSHLPLFLFSFHQSQPSSSPFPAHCPNHLTSSLPTTTALHTHRRRPKPVVDLISAAAEIHNSSPTKPAPSIKGLTPVAMIGGRQPYLNWGKTFKIPNNSICRLLDFLPLGIKIPNNSICRFLTPRNHLVD